MKKIFIKCKDRNELISLLGEALLLYDKVIIDITDFRLLHEIVSKIDKESLLELIESKMVEFTFQEEEIVAMINDKTRNEKNFCYMNENILYTSDQEGKLIKSKILNYEDKITEIVKPYFRNEIIDSINRASTRIKLPLDKVIEVSAQDIENPLIINYIDQYVRDSFTPKNCLANYQLLTEPTIKLPIPHKDYESVIDASKRQIALNTNLRLAYLMQFGDISCENFYSPFISLKLNQLFTKNNHDIRADFLYQLFEIHDFADIKEMLKNGIFSIKDILVLRKTHGEFLKNWINELSLNNNIDSKEFAKEYSKILLSSKSNLTLKSRLITFGLFAGLDTIVPFLGAFTSAGYEFGVKEMAKGWKPKVFFNSVQKILKKNLA